MSVICNQILVSFRRQTNVMESNREKTHGTVWESKSLFLKESPTCSQRVRVKCSCPSLRSTPDTDGVHPEKGYDVGISANTEVAL